MIGVIKLDYGITLNYNFFYLHACLKGKLNFLTKYNFNFDRKDKLIFEELH